MRALDIVLALLALLVLSPLLMPIMVMLKVTGEGEIFYTQQRVGRLGRSFYLLKFATMLKNSPSLGTGTITLKDDPRVLPVGRLLRKTKINELPQLWNVVTGDMSLIGPRPLTEKNFGYYSDDVKAEIIKVRPGLSGVGSIVFRGEEDLMSNQVDPLRFYAETIAPYKGALEVWYVNNRGISTYLQAIILTCWVIVFPSSMAIKKVWASLPEPPPALEGKVA